MTQLSDSPRAAIRRAEAIHVRLPFRRPLLDPSGEYTHRRVWLLRLTDEDGNEGLGEAALPPAADEVTTSSLAALTREAVPALVDGRLDEAALAAEGVPGRALLAAISGAVGALGAVGTRPQESIPVAATIGFGGADAGAEAAAQSVELGFETLELRAGYERETGQLTDRLRAIRAAIGPEPRLRIEVGGAWDLDTATERMRAVERYGIEFVAQPLPVWDLTGHAALRERVGPGVPVALDGAIDSEGAARAALAERAADLLVLRPARLGGAAPALRVAEAAARTGVRAIVGSYLETGVGIAAGLRLAAELRRTESSDDIGRSADAALGHALAHSLATAGVLGHDLLAAPLAIERGRMAVPSRLTLDEDEVRRRTLERFEATTA